MKLVSLGFVFLSTFLAGAATPPDMPEAFRADPKTVVAAAARATTARFPDADVVYLDDRIHTRFEADGSDITWDDEWVKVLTEKGRRSCATVTLDYSERYGDAGILCLEIVGTNGVVRPVDFARTLKVATDNSSLSANIVDPLDKKVSCAVSGLQVGEIRHVRFWRRTRRARMKDAWADVNLLEQMQPILSTVISVDQPAARPVVHAVLRNPLKKTVVRASDRDLGAGRRLLQWTARDVPQAFPEPNMPPLSRCAQTLRLSTVKDWPTVSRWYWNLCAPHLAKTTSAMTNTVTALVAGCTSQHEKIRAVFKFVSQEIRYMGLTLEDTAPGYEPHDVNITFDNRYGVCRDKAALLAALLRIADVKAFPVLIHAGAKMDPEIPTPFFNHAIVAVEVGKGRYTLMDPTDESTKDLLPAYLSDKSYLVARPEGETLLTSPVTSAEQNTLHVASEGTLNEEGDALLRTTFTFDGINDTVVRRSLLKKTPRQRYQWFERVWRGVAAGAELLSLEIEPQNLQDTDVRLVATTVVRLPEVLLHGETRDALSIPFATTALSVVNGILDENTALETRRFPLVLPCTAGTEESLRLTLGEAVGRVRSLPAPAHVCAGSYAFDRTVTCTNGVLTARRTVHAADVNFDVPAYDALRTARKEVETAERETPLFASLEDADAHVRIRATTRVTHIQSPTAWVSTNIVEKEILTYRGKQTSSELKFSYAPSTRHVELVSATVSNRNGKVFSVTPKEINLMDCGWAASAPRYPASKILVVNLPGVEIGSVVRYVVANTVTNAPVAYNSHYPFGSRNPTDNERVELHVPAEFDFRVASWRIPAEAYTVTTNGATRTHVWSMRNPPRVPDESSQPPAAKWRPCVMISFVDWESYGSNLVEALGRAKASRRAADAKARELIAVCPTPADRITAIRTFLRQIRTAGPDLFDLPLDRAFTEPDRLLSEGYGSKADRMNLLRVMLEAAGFDCSFALASDDRLNLRDIESAARAVPRPGVFNALILRAVWREGWIPFLRDETVFWVSAENEWTPPTTSAWFGYSYFDPQENTFGRITPSDRLWETRSDNFCRLEVRSNGAVDFDVTNCTYGVVVGTLRKKFAELLPEMRSRFHQQLLGDLAQNATATSELVTDVKGYPFSLSFGAYAEGYAVAKDDGLTIRIPDFTEKFFGVGGERRQSPIVVDGARETMDTYEVVFPEGYTEIENLPKDFAIRNPRDESEVWLRHAVTSRVEGGRLHVTVRRSLPARAVDTFLGPEYHPFLHDWNRRAAAEAARTISVRKPRPIK